MAGAVSAGAFTAGVIDYLLESLDLWEKAKERNKQLGKNHLEYDDSIPMHDVELEVLSGASAGGITGTLTVLSLLDKKHKFVNKDNPKGKDNLLYQSWVKMADSTTETSLMQLLHTNDLHTEEYPESLLNVAPIEAIADHAVKTNYQVAFPKYVSKSLDLVLTTTNLRGLNFHIDFKDSETVITNHGGFFRYKIANETHPPGIPEKDTSLYFVLDLKDQEHVNYLKNATLSTSAFPIGLKSREIKIAYEYVARYPKYLFNRSEGIRVDVKNEDIYTFNSVDGGLINNEPFGICMKVLIEKNTTIREDDNYAIIMVDPFPNQDHDLDPYDSKRDIISIAKGMFKALRNQVMFNQDGILEALSLSNRTKFLVAPKRKQASAKGFVRSKKDLASTPLSGFGGFLDESFRAHDFHLGRKNCQSFLRYYFAVENKNIKKRFGSEVTEAAKERFSYSDKDDLEKVPTYFPIIPDVRLLHSIQKKYDTKNYGEDANLPYPAYPKFDMEAFDKTYKKPIKKRIRALVKSLTKSTFYTFAFRVLGQRKTYRIVRKTIKKSLEESELL
ncbi:TIGR03607: patatin-related protein [Kordia sp. SMS9]|nr:TIGR03607: patatin-related protein [Kordia sp. SMS9]